MGLIYAGIDEAGYGPLLGPLCVAMSVVRVENWREGEPAPDLWQRLEGVVCREPRAFRGGKLAKPRSRVLARAGRATAGPSTSESAFRKLSRGPMAGPIRGFVPLAINDSKRLKLANSSTTNDPLVYLERAVLTLWRCQTPNLFSQAAAPRKKPDATSRTDPEIAFEADLNVHSTNGLHFSPNACAVGDSAFLLSTGALATLSGHFAAVDERDIHQRLPAWYQTHGADPLPLPRQCTEGELGIWANVVGPALTRASVGVGPFRCHALNEDDFNRVVEEAGTKAAATETALGAHLRHVWNDLCPRAAACGDAVRVVCDRQGGRVQYAASLARLLGSEQSPVHVHILDEEPRVCRYEITDVRPTTRSGDLNAAGTPRRSMIVSFMPEAESAHLPVALASMVAKLTRELLMARFNAYWCARLTELKPTAGYRNDGWRWLEELGDVATEQERRAMIRRA